MNTNQTGNNYNQGGSYPPAPQAPNRKSWFLKIILGAFFFAIAFMAARGFYAAGPKYNTLEEIYNDYQDSSVGETIAETINSVKEENRDYGLDDVTLTVQENEIIATYLISSDSSTVFRAALQETLKSDDLQNEAVNSIKTIESGLAADDITLNGDLTVRYIFRDSSGQEVGQAVYNRYGLASFEGPDITVTMEDVYDDEIFADGRATLEDAVRAAEKSLQEDLPGSSAWMEVHENEINIIIKYNTQRDGIDTAALDKYFRGEEMVSESVSIIDEAESTFKESGIDSISLRLRYTFQDAQGDVFATYVYNRDGVQEAYNIDGLVE